MRMRHGVRGQSTLEYVLVFAAVVITLILSLSGGGLQTGITTMFTKMGDWLTAAGTKLASGFPP